MINETKRLKDIIIILNKYNIVKDRSPRNLRLMIEELGPTFIKMGQILSSRNDLLSEEYTMELKKLRCSVNPMDYTEVQEILLQEYACNINEVFASFSHQPIGSASIAQTHLATLKTGEVVAVKIQRRNIYQMMTLDAKLIKKAIKVLNLDKAFGNIVDFNSVIDEMYDSAKEEMDFYIEAKHVEEFNNNNKDIVYIRPLKVYKELSTRYVLVMEYIEGNFINEINVLKDLGYDLDEISSKLADNYIKQALDDGFFHADPHADNIKIYDGKIVYLDLGMVGRLTIDNKQLLNRCLIDILKNDSSDIAHVLGLINTNSNQIDYMSLIKDIKKVLSKNKTTDIASINIKEFISDMFKLLNNNKITLPKDISMLFRGIVVLEGVLEEINPSINLLDVISNRFNTASVLTNENMKKVLFKSVKSGNDLIAIPSEALTLLKGVNDGELKFNIELNDSKNQLERMEKLIHLAIVTILDLAFIIGISIMAVMHKGELPLVFYLYVALSLIFTLWIFLKMGVAKIKRKK